MHGQLSVFLVQHFDGKIWNDAIEVEASAAAALASEVDFATDDIWLIFGIDLSEIVDRSEQHTQLAHSLSRAIKGLSDTSRARDQLAICLLRATKSLFSAAIQSDQGALLISYVVTCLSAESTRVSNNSIELS